MRANEDNSCLGIDLKGSDLVLYLIFVYFDIGDSISDDDGAFLSEQAVPLCSLVYLELDDLLGWVISDWVNFFVVEGIVSVHCSGLVESVEEVAVGSEADIDQTTDFLVDLIFEFEAVGVDDSDLSTWEQDEVASIGGVFYFFDILHWAAEDEADVIVLKTVDFGGEAERDHEVEAHRVDIKG